METHFGMLVLRQGLYNHLTLAANILGLEGSNVQTDPLTRKSKEKHNEAHDATRPTQTHMPQIGDPADAHSYRLAYIHMHTHTHIHTYIYMHYKNTETRT